MADYELKENVLTIRKDLGWPAEQDLRDWTHKLLEVPGGELVIDLTYVKHMCSANMVAFASLGVMAQKEDRKLKVKASARVARSLPLAGFNEFFEMEIGKR